MTTFILASRSPRRLELLQSAGFAPDPVPADLDDAHLAPPPHVNPLHWVAALAYLKARRVADQRRALTLGADTVVIKNDRIIGQPRDEAHAHDTIRALAGGSHTVATGVAILAPNKHRSILVDAAAVTVGHISPDQIDDYLRSGQWRGKAGAYNLAERQAAGWPLETTGDPATVMGLPMRRLAPILRSLTARDAPSPQIADTPQSTATEGTP